METNNISCEPMDIDLSSQSVKDMDISYNEPAINTKSSVRPSSRLSVSSPKDELASQKSSPGKRQPVVKKYHIKIKRPPRRYKNRLCKMLAAIVIVLISIITYQVLSLKCFDVLNLEILNETLSNKLFGQSEAVKLLIESFDLEAKSKILFIYGGTGVGKTYTSSLLLDTVGTCSNIYHYTMPTFENTFSTNLMWGLVMCKSSLIIVDDLTVNDMNINVHIEEVIEKSNNLDQEITVILIYNCIENHKRFDDKCDKLFSNRLLNNFSDVKALKRFVPFGPLSEKDLKDCIKQELGDRKVTDLEFDNLLKNFDVSVDGCKGVHSKMKYLNTV